MQSTDTTAILVSQNDWESIKTIFLLILATTDPSAVAREICEGAIAKMAAMETETGLSLIESFKEAVDDLMSSDTFSTDHSGYWAYGFCFEESLGWLILEEGCGKPDEATINLAFDSWRQGKDLPKGWHRLNRAIASQVVAAGVKKHGEGFLDGTTDANDADCVLQEVLLGSVVYG